MSTRLRVYLAGPIRGCNEEQRTFWRNEIKLALKKDFDFEDPTEWADDIVLSREISKLEACDILVANMWKESIGTTLGVIRARHQGKPVVLIDVNRNHNAILNGLVAPEKPVYTIEAACQQLRRLATEFAKTFTVRKKDGTEQPFSVKKVVQSVSLAASAAGVMDTALEEQVTNPVISLLRHNGGQHGLVETKEIREALFDRLGWMSADPGQPLEFRARAQAILEAWRKREAIKEAERAVSEAQQTIGRLEAERDELLRELENRDARIRELERTCEPVGEGTPKNLSAALRRLQRDFDTCIHVHEHAFQSALASPYLDTEEAWRALRLLGHYAAERQVAEIAGDKFPGSLQWFKDHQDEVPGAKYAPHESETVGGMYREERTVTYDGVPLYAEQHLCLGDAFDPQYCLRIHFATHRDKTVVAYCGRHLRNAKSGSRSPVPKAEGPTRRTTPASERPSPSRVARPCASWSPSSTRRAVERAWSEVVRALGGDPPVPGRTGGPAAEGRADPGGCRAGSSRRNVPTPSCRSSCRIGSSHATNTRGRSAKRMFAAAVGPNVTSEVRLPWVRVEACFFESASKSGMKASTSALSICHRWSSREGSAANDSSYQARSSAEAISWQASENCRHCHWLSHFSMACRCLSSRRSGVSPSSRSS